MTQLTDVRPAIGAGPALSSPAPRRPSPDFGPTDRARGWAVTTILTTIGAITRFTMLNYPTDAGTPVFDEKHYAPQAWQMVTGGGVEDNPAYGLVVHPPVAKQMIALGEAIFGYTPIGWRFSAAVFGSLLVLLVIRITRRMTRSTILGAIAGLLLTCDGLTFVASRIGMLDIFQALFVLAAFGCLVVDRDEIRARLARADLEGRIAVSMWGPRLGVRWWRFGAGVLLGLATGVKWNGLYFVAAFGLLSVFFDVAARRAYGVPRPWLGTVVRDAVPALCSLVGLPLLVYLSTWGMWFASEDGYDRYSVGNTIGVGGSWSWVPDALRSLWHNQGESLKFHEGLTNSAGYHHPWESKPWSWPMGLRPMLYYYADSGVAGCGQSMCVKAVMLIGTPAMWWLALPMLGWGIWRAVTQFDWRYAAMLIGYFGGLLPWFLDLDRQMYYFYAVPLAPFMVIGFTLALGDILGPAPFVRAAVPISGMRWPSVVTHAAASGPDAHTASGHRFLLSSERQSLGLALVSLYVGVVVANFVWLWPILTALPITVGNWHNHLWLPSWR